jgi:3-deoxy-D-manno-octulosonate 8-phosphate phosphatase (KDO 8-P phosphatase)
MVNGSEIMEEKAAGIKLLILDVDGVLTDGRIVINDLGHEMKFFHVRDGQGLKLLMDSGIEVAIITGRVSKALQHRADELGIEEVHQGVVDKESLLREILERKGLEGKQACCIGDDLPDLPLFNLVGFSVAVADASAEVLDAASYITKNSGGEGAVREVCELILHAQGLWPGIVSDFQGRRK